jgi:hypothetical protein
MNRLINLIIDKRINKNINKFAIAKFINDYKEQFISGELDFNCLHNLHIIMWSRIVQYYEDYTFGPVRIDKVKQKILNKMMKDIKKQTHSLHCCDKSEFISNLESLFRTLKKYNFNCFACYYSCYDAFDYNNVCECCPVMRWRFGNCLEYSDLYTLTKNEKCFHSHKQNIINLSKEIRDLEWSK